MRIVNRNIFKLVFEGTEDTTGGGGSEDKTFTQDQVNKMLAENKRNLQAKNKELETELQKLRAGATSDEERAEYEKRIDDLQKQYMTADELSKKAANDLTVKHKSELDKLSADRDGWKTRYTKETLIRSISDAAVENEAFDASQVVALLYPNARLVEGVDAKGKPTGEFSTKISFKDLDSDGNLMTFELTPQEVVKKMKGNTEKYGNLFKSNLNGGVGGYNTGGKGGDIDPTKMTPEQYRKNRHKFVNVKEAK